jgi:hypothetical protein
MLCAELIVLGSKCGQKKISQQFQQGATNYMINQHTNNKNRKINNKGNNKQHK